MAWMSATAKRPDAAALVGGAVRRTESVGQRPRLLARTGLGRSRRPWIVLGLAAALALPASWLAAGAPLPTQTVPSVALQTPGPTSLSAPASPAVAGPKTLETDFIDRPFEYLIPAGSATRRLDSGGVRELVEWVDGPDVALGPSPAPEDLNPWVHASARERTEPTGRHPGLSRGSLGPRSCGAVHAQDGAGRAPRRPS